MKNNKVFSVVLCSAMAAVLLTGCRLFSDNSNATSAASEATSEEAEITAEADEETCKMVGISMPTKDIQKWNLAGADMEASIKEKGYDVDLQYASNDVKTQISQIEDMISSGADVLVIAAIDGSSLGEALDMAKEANIPVVAYDCLLMDSDAVSYYASFDNYMGGFEQGQYIIDALDLGNAEGPFNLEITAGDPSDGSAGYFYNGAMDILNPYIESGKLVVPSGQTSFDEAATPSWSAETAKTRAEDILSSCYEEETNVDVWLCPNDSTALGVENALAANYTGTYPVITGQGCDIENVKNIIKGKQSMSVFNDTRTLAAQVVKMVSQILNGEEVDVNDNESYDNGTGIIPSYLCEPVVVDADNYKELLIDSGYYTEDQLQ